MRNIYLVQPTTENTSVIYIPYAAGCLASYAWSFEDIQREYILKETFFLRERIEDVIKRIENPFLIGFSCYLWNFEYNKALAKAIKKMYPRCIIVFGGPQIPANASLLEELDYIDILQHYEGEVSFKDMLSALSRGDSLIKVNNLSFRKGIKTITTDFVLTQELDFPSPYQSGFVDDLIKKNPEITFEPLVETNRGCPHKCAYCSWGMVYSKVRQFPIERVFSDLEWCAEHKCEFLGFADANFGMFPRDEKIVEKIIELKNKTGYPKKFQVSYVSYSKGSWERMFRITKRLNENGLSKGVTLSFQSMSPTVQKNIGRSNMNAESYKLQLNEYIAAGIPTYSELILGLPGETYNSLKQGIEEILELGQHSSLVIHLCEWLPLSKMANPEYMAEHGIGYTKIPINQPHAKINNNRIVEYSRIVTSTKTMNADDWVQMNLFSVCVLCFHHLRLLQFPALYLFNEKSIKYVDFYSKLLDYLLKNNLVFSQVESLFNNAIKKHQGTVMYDKDFGNIAWTPEEYVFLKLITQKENFFESIKPFLREFFVDGKILNEIIGFQSFCLKEYNKKEIEMAFDYDWKDYFDNLLKNKPATLKKQSVVYSINTNEYYHNYKEYAKLVIWYGRKGGKNIYLEELERK